MQDFDDRFYHYYEYPEERIRGFQTYTLPIYHLEVSPRSEKKYRVTFPDGGHVDFGAAGYSDYTLHQDAGRQAAYLKRHQARENWTASGIQTAGFWARWLLWNLPSLEASIHDVERRFGIILYQN